MILTSANIKRIVFLDYLRVFAFVSVLVGHEFHELLLNVQRSESTHATIKFLLSVLLPFFNAGAGVTVFFFVSGYIVTHILQTENPTEFLIKRIFRIYPLYVFAVLFEYVLAYTINGSIPALSTLVPQLLLIGQVVDAPLTLGGVEWTLRVEVMFYALMLLLKLAGLFNTKHQKIQPLVYTVVLIFLYKISPFPANKTEFVFAAYSIGLQFLMLGSCFYLLEINRINKKIFAFLFLLIFYQYYKLTDLYQTQLLHDNYAALALLLFFTMWVCRKKFEISKEIIYLSDLTYAIYLFHVLVYNFLIHIIIQNSFVISQRNYILLYLTVLFVFCSTVMYAVEKPSIKLGKKILSKLPINR